MKFIFYMKYPLTSKIRSCVSCTAVFFFGEREKWENNGMNRSGKYPALRYLPGKCFVCNIDIAALISKRRREI